MRAKPALVGLASAGILVDSACTIDSRAFTGIRIWKQWQFDPLQGQVIPDSSDIIITQCSLGQISGEITLSDPLSLFNHTLCPSIPGHGTCIRLIRQQKFTDTLRLHFLPGTIVGLIYTSQNIVGANNNSDTSNTDPSWEITMPLVAQPLEVYTSAANTWQLNIRESLFRSPDVLDRSYPRNDEWRQPYQEIGIASPIPIELSS